MSVLRARRRALWNGVVRASWSKRFVYALLAVFAGVYLVTYARIVATLCEKAGDPLPFLIRNFGFAFVFMQLYAISFALQWLAHDDDLTMLVSLPVSRRALFVVKFLDIAFDLIRLYALPSPLFIGAALPVRPSPGRWALYIVSGALTWAFVTAIGMGVALTLNRLSPRRRFVGFFRVASTLTIFGVIASFMAFGVTVRGNGGFPDLAATVTATPPALLSVLPTTWTYRVLVAAAPWAWFGGLAVLCAGSIVLARTTFVAWFDAERATSTDSSGRRRIGSRTTRRRAALTALVVKEWRLLARNPTQLATLIGPVIVFALFTRFVAPGSNPPIRVAFTGFFVAFTFGLQLVGAEGDRIALLRSALTGMGPVLVAKAILTATILLPITLVLVVDWQTRIIAADHLVIAVLLTLGYATFSVGMGAITPRFRARNPMRSARLPAILATYVYFAITVAAVAWYEESHPAPPVAIGIFAIPVVVGVGILGVGARRLARRDIL
jgi:hypothetical protein